MNVTANLIRQVVEGEDAKGCVIVADALRAHGFNYSRTWRMVSNLTGISQADWDELLQEGEQ